jgi:DNA-directed RNA polymerase specialized sigma24 family protein
MEAVIEFKREVYQKALEELARYLRRHAFRRFDDREQHEAVNASVPESGSYVAR